MPVEYDGWSAPEGYASPDWSDGGRVHNWRNHVPEHMREIWQTFSDEQRQHLALWADALARNEYWE